MVAITTTNEESSEDFGGRLFEQIKVDNRAKEKAFRKREKREARQKQIMELSTRVGMGLGDAYFQNKTNDFLNTEEMVGKTLRMRTAYNTASQAESEEKKARESQLGYEGYFNSLGRLRAEPGLKENFGTNRNVSQFEDHVLIAGNEIGENLRNQHEERLKLTQAYMSARGVEEGQDVFLKEIKKNSPSTVGAGITKMLGNFIGLTSDQQISTRAEKIFTTGDQLMKFQDNYNETNDAEIASIVAVQTPKNLKSPASIVGKEIKFLAVPNRIAGRADIQMPYKDLQVWDREGGYYDTQLAFLNPDGSTSGDYMSAAKGQNVASYQQMVAAIEGTPQLLNTFKGHFQSQIPKETQEDLNDKVQERVDDDLSSAATGTKRTDLELSYYNRMYARMGASTQIIEEQTGMNENQAAIVSAELFLQNPTIDGTGAFKNGAGISTPYAVLQAMAKTHRLGTIRMNGKMISTFIGRNGEHLVKSYLDASRNERVVMDENLTSILSVKNDLIPIKHFTQIQGVAKVIANNPMPSTMTLAEKMSVAEVMLGKIDLEIDELRENTGTGAPEVNANPDDGNAVWEWVKDNPKGVITAVSVGLLFTPPGTAAAGVIGLGNAALRAGSMAIKAGQTAWKFKKPFYDYIKKKAKGQFYTKDIDTQIGVRIPGKLDKAKAAAGIVLTVPPALNALESLLSKPEEQGTSIVIPEDANVPETVVDKVSYVGNILGDNENEIAFMKGVVKQESNFGNNPNTYNMTSDGAGRFGVAQVDKVAFDEVQKKLRDKNSRIFKFLKPFKDQLNVDLSQIAYADLRNDVLSIAFGRLYLKQLTEEKIPSKLEEQAVYWKKYYNTSAGKGKTEDFITTNSTA